MVMSNFQFYWESVSSKNFTCVIFSTFTTFSVNLVQIYVTKTFYAEEFFRLFSLLPAKNIDPNLNSLVRSALSTYAASTNNWFTINEYAGFYSDDYFVDKTTTDFISDTDLLSIILEGLLSHTRRSENLVNLLKSNIISTLLTISEDPNADDYIISLILKLIANLTMEESAIDPIIQTGCLKFIKDYSESDNIALQMPAKRALYNLDRQRFPTPIPTGVYVLHPKYDCDNCDYIADVIFIHGLLGGAPKTWRRQDEPDSSTLEYEDEETSNPSAMNRFLSSTKTVLPNPLLLNKDIDNYPVRKYNEKGELVTVYENVPPEPKDSVSTPTQCWPKDWLPEDCPFVRVIVLDFETFVTRWKKIYPIEPTERSLEGRGRGVMQKLKTLNVGDKPIVWVTHSMGGLVLKSLLCQADEVQEYQNMVKNTSGIAFCSVPHLGTKLALLQYARRYVFLPTEEIDDLAYGNEKLIGLNQCFLTLTDSKKYRLLSFGEKKNTVWRFGFAAKLVSHESSDIGIGEYFPLPVNHLNTVKPWSRRSFLYTKIVDLINISVKNKTVKADDGWFTRILNFFR